MSQTGPVTNSRRAALAALMVTLAALGGLIGLRWVSTDRPAPTSAAVLPTPGAQPSASPPASVPPTTSPTPAQPPTPTPSPTPPHTPRPTDGLASVRVLTPAEFQAVFVSRQFVGTTLVVDGRIEPFAQAIGDQIGDRLSCDGEDACVYGALSGAAINGGTRPLLVWSRRIAIPLGPDDVVDEYTWPSRARTELPIEGELVLRIDTTYSVEYLGRAAVDAASDVWTPSSAAVMEKADLELDQVLLVDGWLGQSTIRVSCPPSDSDGLLPRHFCGERAWIAPARETGWDGDGEEVLGVQPNAYSEFAPNPRRDPGADAYVARHGLMAVGVRLERDGCFDPPCPAWQVLGWVAAQPDIAAAVAQPGPTAVPETGWVQLTTSQTAVSARWSPDSRWLLVTTARELLLVDVQTGETVRRWDFDAGMFTRGAVWIDDHRFLAFSQPPEETLVHDGLGPAVMGSVDRDALVSVEVPVGYEYEPPYIAALGGGDGAVAFETTRVGEGECGPNGCVTFRIWTPQWTSDERRGMPIAWSSAGDRLAVIHNDQPRRGPGIGAGFGGYSGWLEVVSWPGLETVFADRQVIVHQDSAFDPTGHWLASAIGPLRIVNLDTGRVSSIHSAASPPLWDSNGNLVATTVDGDVVTIDLNGRRVGRWVGAGHRIVGTADGATQVVFLHDPLRGAPPGFFTVIRDGAAYQFALPLQNPDAPFGEHSVSPDGKALYVRVSSSGQLLFRHLP